MPDGWSAILHSPTYLETLQRLQAQAQRQFKAVPSADPAIKQATMQEGVRQAQLAEIGSRLQQGEREIGLDTRRVGMAEKALSRYAKRLPVANLIGLGSVGLGALSAYGNIRQLRAQDASQQRMLGLMNQQLASQTAAEEAKRRHAEQMQQLYGGFEQRMLAPVP